MPRDSAAVLSGEPAPVFQTGSVRDPDLLAQEESQRNRAAWDRFVDRTLVEWGRNPAALEDEGFIPPSYAAVSRACEVAMFLRDKGLPPPTKIVPDGEGGICFERAEGESSVSLNINADQTMELLTFDDCRLRARYPVG
jgi:hypothetical protein